MKRKAEATDAVLVTPEIEALGDALRGTVEPAGVERALVAFREAGGAAGGVARGVAEGATTGVRPGTGSPRLSL